MTNYIDIGSMESGSYQVIARCVLRDHSSVVFEGDEEIIGRLRSGIPYIDGHLVTVNDGLVFLRAVRDTFSSYPFSVSVVQEGEPPSIK